MKNIRRQDGERLAKGFTHAGDLVKARFRSAAERKGFAATQLFAAWPELVGADIASMSEPIDLIFDPRTEEVTLTLLSSGPYAEQVRLTAPVILERVNASFGYKAVEQIKVTQSWKGKRAGSRRTGHGETARQKPAPYRESLFSTETIGEFHDPELKAALTELGNLVYSQPQHDKKDPK